MTDLVTGDAVVLELRIAELPSRALAFLIDLALMCTIGALAAIGFFRAVAPDEMLAAAVGLALFVAVFVGYPVVMETLTRGRSVGKIALGLRVVRDDGGPIRLRQALVRGLAGLIVDFYGISAFTGAVAVITSLVSPRGRRLGDMLAGTIVVRERVPGHRTATLVVPAPLAGWAESLDVCRVPDALALQVRQFLGRVGELDPARRRSLGAGLADQVLALVSPPPPAGAPPEALLTAVLVVRRGRAEARSAALRAAVPRPRPVSDEIPAEAPRSRPVSGESRPRPVPDGIPAEAPRPGPVGGEGADPARDGFVLPR